MATPTRPMDILGNVFSDIDNIKKILNNAKEIKKMYDKTDFNNTVDVKKLVKATKEMIDNLETKATNIHAYFKNNYSNLLQDVHSLELNGDTPGHKEIDNHLGNGKLTEVNNTVDSTNNESGTEKNGDNVITSTDNDHSEVVGKQTESTEPKQDLIEVNQDSDEKKVFLKCVDISKLINPNILPHFDKSKSSSKKNDPVFIILDSDSDEQVSQTYTRKRKTISKTVAKKSNNAKVLRSSSLDNENSTTKTRWTRNAKRRKISYVNPSSSEFSSLSDFDSDEVESTSRARTTRKTRQAFNEKKILNAQSDQKFSYKAYVPLERVPCEKLKENYLREKERLEVKRLTNLKSLNKRQCTSPSTRGNNVSAADSDNHSKRKRKHKSKNIDCSEGDSSSDSSDISTVLEAVKSHTETLHNDQHEQVLEDNVVEEVLDALASELPDNHKSDEDTDENEESRQKDKQQNKEQQVSAVDDSSNQENDPDKSKEKEGDSALPETEDNNSNHETSKEQEKESNSADKTKEDDKSNEQETLDDSNRVEETETSLKEVADAEDTSKKKSSEEETVSDGNNSEDTMKKLQTKETSDADSDPEDKKKKNKNKETEDESDGENNKKKKDSSESESDSENTKNAKSKDKGTASTSAEDNCGENDKKKSKEKKRHSSSSSDSDKTNKNKKKSSNRKGTSSSESENDSDHNKKKKSKEKKRDSSSSSDSDSTNKNKKKNSKGKGTSSSESENDSDNNKKKKSKEKSKWRRDRLLNEKLSETDSEAEFDKYRKKHEQIKKDAKQRYSKKKTTIIVSDSDENSNYEASKDESNSSSSSSSEAMEVTEKEQENKKRRRIRRVQDSSDDGEEGNKSTRRTIRKVIAHESLAESTKRAEKDERERKARILERQKKYNQIFELPQDSKLEKLVLDFDEESKKELLSVNKQLVQKLKPHQGKGVQFMWDTCYESVERAKSTRGSGCILAHCMGLGKTLQVIALTHTLLNNSETVGVNKVLVVCPLNTVLNWEAEYRRWLSDVDSEEINVFELVSCKNNLREFVVDDWHKDGGVLIIGYDMFRNLTNPTNKRLKKRARESFQRGLVDPGPDLVICDEGHLLKNEKTHLSIAMNRIHTARRIVLTGTPMQNNLKEYYCMVQFVKPNLLGTYKEYINRFVNPITNGQYTDSTPHDINIMRKRSHVLHTMLDGIVQRKDYAVLTPYLPPKYEYVLFLKLTPVQIKLYQHYKDNFSQTPSDGKVKSSFLFRDFQEFQRICTHPRVLLMKSRENQLKDISTDEDSEGSLKDFIDDKSEKSASTVGSSSDSDSSESQSKTSVNNSRKRVTRTAAATMGIDVEVIEDSVPQGWWSQYCSQDELEQIDLSSKLYLLFKILEECELVGDKLLVFSQSLMSLNIIEYFLAKIEEATQKGDSSRVCGFSGSWTLGLDYFRLDGSSSCDNRLNCCKLFNDIDNPRARLFLISTKAGGLGINLVGANRVVIFDVSWNPSHDVQSIYRVYRFGQTKPCYIYRFVIWGTMEMKIYERQVTKQAISKRVIDEQQIDRHYNQNDLAELYLFDPEPDDNIIPLVPKDVLLGELLQKEKNRIYKYHEHQSLLENKQDEELNEAERKAAWEEFEHEKTARVVNTGSLGWIRNLPISSITIALRNIVQKDNPSWPLEQVTAVIPSIIQQLRTQVEAGKLLLFQRIVDELRSMQASQQNYQAYIKKQQQYQQQQQQQQMNLLRQHIHQQMFPQLNSNEIVELID